MKGWVDGHMDGAMDGVMSLWMNGGMSGWDELRDGWTVAWRGEGQRDKSVGGRLGRLMDVWKCGWTVGSKDGSRNG